MLEVYLYTTGENLIRFNDAFFDANLLKINFDSDLVQSLISIIDGGRYIGGFSFVSRISKTSVSVTELSTGCKTAINVFTFPDMIVDIVECGINAVEEIFKLDKGRVFIGSPTYIPYNKNKDIVVFDGYKRRVMTIEKLNRVLLGEGNDYRV